MLQKSLATLGSLLVMLVALYTATGCAKEYSYEQKLAGTTPIDTVPPRSPEPALTSCALCNYDVLPDSSWRFSMDGVIFCGKTDGAIALQQRTSFTFFGPSACSADSGFVATVRLEDDAQALTGDQQNVRARLICYYYDKVGSTYPFMSPRGDHLILNITAYNHQARVVVGNFSGIVETVSGTRKEIKDGRFRIRL